MFEAVQAQVQPATMSLWLQTSTGQTLAVHARRLWPAASLIKLGIAVYGHAAWQRHPDLLQRRVTLAAPDIVGGAGRLRFLAQHTFTVGDLLQLMLMDSDNTAANALLRTFGFAQVATWLVAFDPQLHLRRRFMAPTTAGENELSAHACGRLLAQCFQADAYWQLCQRSLRHQANRLKLPYAATLGAWPGVTVYNKTGELPGFEHDAARFVGSQRWVACVVLAQVGAARTATLGRLQTIGRLLAQWVQDP